MNEIIDYFSNMPSHHRAIIIAGGITFFWLIESFNPFLKFQYNKWKHGAINIFFTITTVVINFSMALILLNAAQWTTENKFGLLNWLSISNMFVFTCIGLLIMDFIGAYLIHLIEHKIKFLWRFHLVHHTDTWIDTTSANRHHPGESILRFTFTTLAVFIVGAPMWMVFMYQSLSVITSQFNHANIVLPKKIDTLLSYFLVTPDMHKVHHHYVLPYTDSNYGNIFSVWDRLFGTFKTLDREKLIYGVDTHMDTAENNRLRNLLLIPFQKYRSPNSN
jgi:sterol desaturase/sphingolipid hydroxylase (fatty acid hydroxylase superfamily)